MVAPTLLTGAALDLVAAGLFAWVALRVASRPTQTPGAARALQAFGLWWASAAAIAALSALTHGLAAAGALDLALLATARLLSFVPLCAGMAGALAYFVFLLTGREDAWKAIAAYYGAWLVVVLYAFVASGPQAVVAGTWRVDLAFARPFPPPVFGAMVVLTVGPPLVAALASLRLLRTEADPTRRYRVALVSIAVALWFATLMAVRLVPDDALQFAAKPVLGLGIATLTVWAYDPPGLVRRWAGIEALPRAAPVVAAVALAKVR